MFNAWNKALGPRVEVVPVEILNRERFATLRQLVDEVNDQLRSALDGPHVFFGHSFGALLAYRLACLRAASGSPLPRALMVSSFAPPHLPAPIPAVDHLDDHQLTALLSDLGGIPPELTEWPALRDQAVAAARIDLRLCMTDEEAEPVTLVLPDPRLRWQRRPAGDRIRFARMAFADIGRFLCAHLAGWPLLPQ